jgi:hypothetical protein
MELPEHILDTMLIIVESQPHQCFDGPNSPPQSDRAILTLAGAGECIEVIYAIVYGSNMTMTLMCI